MKTVESAPAESVGMRHWRLITRNKQFYGQNYWSGDKAQAWGGGDYADGPAQATLARLVRRHLLPAGGSILEAGCAFGFLARRLHADGYAVTGFDTSGYCLAKSVRELRGKLQAASVLALPYPDRRFDLVMCLEVLEHLPEELIPQAIAELRRVSRGLLLVSVPTYGANDFGPYGLKFHTDPENDDWRRDAAAGRAFTRLDIDEKTGEPRCGHLTHATFRWWTERFRAQGLARDGELEQRMYADAELDLRYWQLYALRPPAAAWQGEGEAQIFGAGWSDRGELDGRVIRWSGAGEMELHPAAGAPAVELELFAGPRRLTYPYAIHWRSGTRSGEFETIPGELLTVNIPVTADGTSATVTLRGGPAWTTAALFGKKHPAAPVRGGWGLLAVRPSSAGEFAVTRQMNTDWQPAALPDGAAPDGAPALLTRFTNLFK